MKKLISCLLLLVFLNGYSQHRLGFRIAANTSNQHYQMRVNTPVNSALLGEPIFIDINSASVVYTGAIYPPGISIFFMQQEGPQQTYYNGKTYGVITTGNADQIIDLSLDPPPPQPQPNGKKVIMTINQPGAGEVFDFSLEKAGRRITYLTLTSSNYQQVATDKLFQAGDTICIIQNLGPRLCNLSSRYVLPATGDLDLTLNCGNPPAPKDRAILLSISKPGPKEVFDFIIEKGDKRITNLTLTETNYQQVSTGKLFAAGDTLKFTQTLGPRVCNAATTYMIPATGDLQINLDCGTPPPPKDRAVILSISKPGAGEVFDFIIEKGDRRITNLTLTASSYQNVATGKFFAAGDTLSFKQTMGPRVCNAAPTYIIPASGDLKITLNCGVAAPTPGTPRIGLRINKPPLGKSFAYRIYKKSNNQELSSMTITAPETIGYFPGPLNAGDTVYLFFVPQTQMFSNIRSLSPFVIPNKDTLIDVSMGFLVAINLDRFGLNEKFKFELRHTGQPKDTVEVSAGNSGLGYFMKNRFYEGDTLYARQLSGPRVCGMPPFTIMTNTNTFIRPQCGAPGNGDSNLYQVGVRIRDYDAGSYGIQIGSSGQFITVRDSVYDYGRSFYHGDTVLVSQFFGNKTVKFVNNPVVVGHSDVIVDGYIGALPVKKKVSGTYAGPAGSKITLRTQFNEEITVTASSDGIARFSFPREYNEGDLYSVSIKTPPPNCNCAITPSAEGVMPLDSTGLKVICNTAVELASRSTDNKFFNTFYETAAPVIGGMGEDEGRYVAFVSYGAGLDGSAGKYRQVFWRDMKTGVTKMISRGMDGGEGNNNSLAPAISADGKAVAFESYATNLVGGDNNGARDVYLWKEGAGISWVSQGGNSESFEPRLDRDGHSVVFSSGSSTLTGGVEGTSTVNVYLSNGGAIQLLSKDPKTGKGVGGSAPDISEDGDRILFCSISAKLTSDDNNGLWDIFLWNKGTVGLKRISKTAAGAEREQGDESSSRVVQASISGNGKFAVYATTAGNMVPYDNNKVQDVFITDLSTGRVSRLSLNNNAEEGNGDSPVEQGGRIGVSYDGKWVCFQTNATNMGVAKGNIVMKNFVTGETRVVTNSNYNTAGRPLISRYGVYVVAGCSEKMDKRFPSSGIFRFFTGK